MKEILRFLDGSPVKQSQLLKLHPSKTNMKLEKQPWMKMYLLLKQICFAIVMLVFGGVLRQQFAIHNMKSIQLGDVWLHQSDTSEWAVLCPKELLLLKNIEAGIDLNKT